MTDSFPDSHQPKPLLVNRLKPYASLLIGQFVWWYSLVLLGPMFISAPGIRNRFEFGMAYVFLPPAVFFAIVFTLQANWRVFKTCDVVIVLIALVVLTTVNLVTMASMMPRC